MISHWQLAVNIGNSTYYKKLFSETLVIDAVKELIEAQLEFTISYKKGKVSE